MKKKILINAAYPEEKRVAILEGDTLVDFYVEVASREHLKSNIYKGVVTRVEPGIQAVFVNFGARKDGFLQIKEISQEYFGKGVERRKARLREVFPKGREIIVQVEKEERDTKGASLTTYLSLPGRYMVLMPGREKVSISRKIESAEERDYLKEVFSNLKVPDNMGFILRTAGKGRTEEELSSDLKYLTKLWNKIERDAKKVPGPALIYKEEDISVRTVRDYLTSETAEVLVDDAEAYRGMKEFLKKTVPQSKIAVRLYKGVKPIFSKYSIEDEIAKINERYMHLPSRGYIVFDKTEALTAIDVNSGRSRKEENVEATALRTNLEAAEEIARQLRLRDIGGLIVIDFIDMASHQNRREVENTLKNALKSDKAHWEISGISKFGIVEMTRERMRPAYFESMHRACDACGGAGVVRSDETAAIAALRDIRTRASSGETKLIHCTLPVGSLNYLINARRNDITSIEKEFKTAIRLSADTRLLSGRFEVSAEKAEEKPKHEEVQAEIKPEETPVAKAEETEQPVVHEDIGVAVTAEQPKPRSRKRPRYRQRRRKKAGKQHMAPGTEGALRIDGLIPEPAGPEQREDLDEPSQE